MYERILAEALSTPWAILPEKLGAIVTFLTMKSAGGGDPPAIQAAAPRRPQVAGGVAVLPIFGTISKRVNLLTDMSGGTSTDVLTGAFRSALADPDVRAIIFDVDSPGGTVPGGPELADEILKARGVKKMVTVVNPLCASLALWIGSAADEVVITPSGSAGSLGVYAAFQCVAEMEKMAGVETVLISADISPFKTEFSPHQPLSESAREELQRSVNLSGEQFVDAVAKARGIPTKKVKADFGQGRLLEARRAVAAGMADRVGTLDETISRLMGRGKGSGGMRAEEWQPLVAGSGEDDPAVCADAAEEIEATASPHELELRERKLQLVRRTR